jgi:hypothetical protein
MLPALFMPKIECISLSITYFNLLWNKEKSMRFVYRIPRVSESVGKNSAPVCADAVKSIFEE